MKYKIEFIKNAVTDYNNLDGSLKKLATKKINNLSTNPYMGKALGNKFNINLSRFYKLYFNNKKHRIIYRIINEQIEIIEIWGIGKRDKEKIYKLINERLNR